VNQLTRISYYTFYFLGKEEAASLVLAQEQVLESEHVELKKEESAMKAELDQTSSAQKRLQELVHDLEERNNNLTGLVHVSIDT
jgi:uncharacterized protein involved in exopolysaccharide biosynthesis